MRGRTASVDCQVEAYGAQHPAQSREHGKDDPGTLSELADVELPSCLEPDNQKEKAHEPAIDPATQIQRHRRLTDVYGHLGLPYVVVRGRVDVRPDQRGDCSPKEQSGACGLRLQEAAKGGVAPQPRRTSRISRLGRWWPQLPGRLSISHSSELLANARSRPLYNWVQLGWIRRMVRRREAVQRTSLDAVDELKHLAKVRLAGSNPVFSSTQWGQP